MMKFNFSPESQQGLLECAKICIMNGFIKDVETSCGLTDAIRQLEVSKERQDYEKRRFAEGRPPEKASPVSPPKKD